MDPLLPVAFDKSPPPGPFLTLSTIVTCFKKSRKRRIGFWGMVRNHFFLCKIVLNLFFIFFN